MKDLKNTISTIAGLLFVIAGGLITASTQTELPKTLITVCYVVSSVSAAVVFWATGRNPDLTKKTTNQLNKTEQEK